MKLRKTNSMMTSIALLTGIAVGAAISALFAPKSGKETRRNVAGAIKGIVGASLTERTAEVKDHLVEDLREQTKLKADQLTGNPEEAVDLTKTTIREKGPKSRQVPTEPQI
ncbi:YtxH-like protein [Pedobacter westerhofensis]|uniref:YtxH-like protein n=1 Tax=Pedobacter westerhofensis TaxID=425512 RepID=A0A521CQB4_9SPHI|nr:YtxH domain-containing protein [Pedobacter westerhofensis]SMO61659.1 YtxH-like protein [Pedobacter westerhofensis]